jgi:hypothetical protein
LEYAIGWGFASIGRDGRWLPANVCSGHADCIRQDYLPIVAAAPTRLAFGEHVDLEISHSNGFFGSSFLGSDPARLISFGGSDGHLPTFISCAGRPFHVQLLKTRFRMLSAKGDCPFGQADASHPLKAKFA